MFQFFCAFQIRTMHRILLLALIGTWCVSLSSGKVTMKRSLVVSTEGPQEDDKSPTSTSVTLPQIYQMRVDTNVSNRYAHTQITSKVRNLSPTAQEATFSVVTPDQAFISGFIMELDGKKYEAYVQEKEEAKQTYNQAIASGQFAAHVEASARDSNRFTVSVNVEPESKATFYLTYEELLVRKDDKYEIVLNIHPGQPVKDLSVEVNIAESRPLKFVKTPSLRSGNELLKNNSNLDPEAVIKNVNETSAVVSFSPDIARQRILAGILGGKEEDGLSGQFIVQYDVARDPEGGEVLVDGGHFVHFFAPENLTPLKKQVIFVLDTSGSMGGIRITQLKEAMDSILAELKPEDVFSIVEFNSLVKVWDVPEIRVSYKEGESPLYLYEREEATNVPIPQVLPPSFAATENNIRNAKKVVKELYASGGTDIQSALKIGLQIVSSNSDSKIHQPIIVFLTDGEPTVGEYNTEKIISTIANLNINKVPIFSLSFGDGADREFLKKLSLKNLGFARHIYEAADAYIQLQDFYRQVSSPLLSNVTFKYTDKASNVTKSHFPILFGGGELFVTGILRDTGFAPPAVEAWGIHGPIQLQPKVYQVSNSLERLWAYLTVKQLLEQREVADNKTGPTQEALRLALKYSFVTDVSSLVVVKPNDTSAVDTVDAAVDASVDAAVYAAAAAPPFSPSYPGLVEVGSPKSAIVPIRKIHKKKAHSKTNRVYNNLAAVVPLRGAIPAAFTPSLSKSAMDNFAAYQGVSTSVGYPSHRLFTSHLQLHNLLESTTITRPNLPWLADVLNENGTITVDSEAYSLGDGVFRSTYPCQNTLNNLNGTCVHLYNCPEIHLQLTDFSTYKKHFCKLDSFAGVCCPDPITP